MRRLQAAGGTAISQEQPEQGRRPNYGLLISGIGLIGLIVDQALKAWALAALDPQRPVPLFMDLVSLHLIRNPGAAFSMGESFTVALTVLAIAALLGVAFWAIPRVRHPGWAVTLGLLLAGIAGNLTDRLFRDPGPFQGHVVDFIQVRYFAIFNFADICITAAAILIAWLSLVRQVGLDGSSLNERKHVEASDGVKSGHDE